MKKELLAVVAILAMWSQVVFAQANLTQPMPSVAGNGLTKAGNTLNVGATAGGAITVGADSLGLTPCPTGQGYTWSGVSWGCVYIPTFSGTFTNNRVVKATGTGSVGDSLLSDDSTTLSYNTNKFTVAASSGNTAIAGTLGISGQTTIAASIGDDAPLYVRNTNVTGFSGVALFDNSNTFKTEFGYGNTSAGTSFLQSKSFVYGDVPFVVASTTTPYVYFDPTNKRVGIGLGTSAPLSALHVKTAEAGNTTVILQNTSSTGFTAIDMKNNSGTQSLGVGYDNNNTRSFIDYTAHDLYFFSSGGAGGANSFKFTNDATMQFFGSTGAVSESNTGRIRYTTSGQKFQVSTNGGAYADLLSSANVAGTIGTYPVFSGTNAIGNSAFPIAETSATALTIGDNQASDVATVNGRVLVTSTDGTQHGFNSTWTPVAATSTGVAAMRALSNGTWDTSGGAKEALAMKISAAATRGVGASNLTNVAGDFNAANADVNIAVRTIAGSNYFHTSSGSSGFGYTSGAALPSLLSVNGTATIVGATSLSSTLDVTGLSTLTGGFTLGADSSAGSHKIANLTNGSASSDAAAFGQIGTAVNAAVSGTLGRSARFIGTNGIGNGALQDDGTNLYAQNDDSYFAWDTTANNRLGFTKKSGGGPKLTYGSTTTFAIAQSSAASIAAANTFTDRLTISTTGAVAIPGTLGVTGLITATAGVTTPANLTTTGSGDLVSADDLTVADAASITGTLGVGLTTPTTLHASGSLFPSTAPKAEIVTGTCAACAYNDAVVIRHSGFDVGAVTRRLGLLFKLNTEASLTESNKSGGMVLESTSTFANSPVLSLVTADAKRVDVTALGSVTINAPTANNNALTVNNGGGTGQGIRINNTTTGNTASATAELFINPTSSYDATAGAMSHYGIRSEVAVTKSAGVNALTEYGGRFTATGTVDNNTAIFATATGATTSNVALQTDDGNAVLNRVSGTTTIGFSQATANALQVSGQSTFNSTRDAAGLTMTLTTAAATNSGLGAVIGTTVGTYDTTGANKSSAGVFGLNTATETGTGSNTFTAYGVRGSTTGAVDLGIGVSGAATGAGTLNIGGLFTATGATTKLAIRTDDGDNLFNTISGVSKFQGTGVTFGTSTTTVHITALDTSARPTLTNCGTGATIVGNDASWKLTTGTGAGACTVTFNQAYSANASCTISEHDGTKRAFTLGTTTLAFTAVSDSAVYSGECREH